MQDSTCCHIRYSDFTSPTPQSLHFAPIRLLSPVAVCLLDGELTSNEIYRFVSNTLFRRMMRRTGKLYSLTLVSVSLGVLASVSVSLWNFNTPEFHLWLDLTPQGFGIASMITTTLIVSFRAPGSRFLTPVAVVGHDGKHSQGGYRRCYRYHLSLPDDRSSARGQLERGTSPGHPDQRASEADHRTWGYRGLIHASLAVSRPFS